MLAFAAPQSPLDRPILVVGTDPRGAIDNLSVPSDVAAGYAPAGASLVLVTVRPECALSDTESVLAVKREATQLLGAGAQAWRHLETVHVPKSLPEETLAARRLRPASPRVAEGLFVAGDWCTSASINGALASGRIAAEAILAERG
jgi:predicted NAD/FAD-dependent oxidoreductase